MPGPLNESIVPFVRVRPEGACELEGTGIAISPHAVLACRHVVEVTQTVLRGKQLRHATHARVVQLEQQNPVALGDVQLKGDASRGFSGAPVVAKSRDDQFVEGMLGLGCQESATSRMIGTDAIAAFLAEEQVDGFAVADLLTALKQSEKAVRVGRQAATLFRELLAGARLTAAEFMTKELQASIDNTWPNYAICLIALASPLNPGRLEESLAATGEAVAILTQLVEESDEFYPLLAGAEQPLPRAGCGRQDRRGASLRFRRGGNVQETGTASAWSL
jgi:hypothetical protein